MLTKFWNTTNKRSECRQLLDKIPDDGLEETIETLKELIDFYTPVRESDVLLKSAIIEFALRGSVVWAIK